MYPDPDFTCSTTTQPWSRRNFGRGLVYGGAALGAGMTALQSAPLFASSSTRYLSQFPNVNAAFLAWSQAGGTLVIDRDADIVRPIAATFRPGVSYALLSQGERRLIYRGPAFHWALRLIGTQRNQVQIKGSLTIDGNGRVAMPFFAWFGAATGNARADFLVDGLTCRNAQMSNILSPVDGRPLNTYGATGMMFQGGFNRLSLRNVAAHNIDRTAGSGVLGSRGCAGIAVVAKMGTTQSARHITLEDFSVSAVDASDAYGSPARGDMDGVLMFQSAEAGGTRPIIRRGEIINAAGRAIKVFAPGGGGLTENISIARSRPAGPTGSIDVQHQHGDGSIRNIFLSYSGDAHRNPTTCVGMTSNSKRPAAFPFTPGVIENITIRDTTGMMKHSIVGLHYYITGDATSRRFTIAGVSDNGSANTLLLPGVLGRDGRMELLLSNIDVNLAGGLMASEDRTPGFQVDVVGPVTLSSDFRSIPMKVDYKNRRVAPRLEVAVNGRTMIRGLRQ